MLEQADKDFLTGLYRRESLDDILGTLIKESSSKNRNFSIALIDLDRFKKFNDRFGHLFGDAILKYAASMLRLTFYEKPLYLFRYGGDEFVVVFPDTEYGEAFNFLRQCVHNMSRRPFLFKNRFFRIAISSGIASFPQDAQTRETLLQKADEAMYFSKRHGSNFVTVAGKLHYLNIRNSFLIIASILAVFWLLFVAYKFVFREAIHQKLREFKTVRFVTKPENLDVIILKDGSIFEGRVLEETERNIIFSLYLKKGEGFSTFDKSDIAKVKLRLRKSPPEKSQEQD